MKENVKNFLLELKKNKDFQKEFSNNPEKALKSYDIDPKHLPDEINQLFSAAG